MADTVVLAGECDLVLPETASAEIDVVADGEYGQITEINKIPSNYGLITWTGSVLIVS